MSESQGLETSGEEQLFTSQKQSTTSTTSEKKTTSDNYSTGSKDSFFGEEEESSDITSNIEEQITEENKTWSVIDVVDCFCDVNNCSSPLVSKPCDSDNNALQDSILFALLTLELVLEEDEPLLPETT